VRKALWAAATGAEPSIVGMSVDEKITIMDQDVAAGSIGFITAFPSFRHVVFARSPEDAAKLASRFREVFGIDLNEDFLTKKIGQRLGVTVLSFSDENGKVKTSKNVVEVSDLLQARDAVPEISAGASIRSSGQDGPVR
jgi:hypothetical protein